MDTYTNEFCSTYSRNIYFKAIDPPCDTWPRHQTLHYTSQSWARCPRQKKACRNYQMFFPRHTIQDGDGSTCAAWSFSGSSSSHVAILDTCLLSLPVIWLRYALGDTFPPQLLPPTTQKFAFSVREEHTRHQSVSGHRKLWGHWKLGGYVWLHFEGYIDFF